MNKKLSSLKIHNIVVCAIILIVFVIFGVANARAEEINNNDEVLPSNNIQLGKNYRKLIEENNVDNFKLLEEVHVNGELILREVLDEIKLEKIKVQALKEGFEALKKVKSENII